MKIWEENKNEIETLAADNPEDPTAGDRILNYCVRCGLYDLRSGYDEIHVREAVFGSAYGPYTPLVRDRLNAFFSDEGGWEQQLRYELRHTRFEAVAGAIEELEQIQKEKETHETSNADQSTTIEPG